jgi:HD-GYP domain-containing protein (c-di-GMP phosphodiesterase class II)
VLETEYVPISIATLLPAEVVGIDLYQQDRNSGRVVLYRAANFPLSFDDLERLRNRGVHRLLIRNDARDLYQQYLRRIARSDDQASVPHCIRATALTEMVRDVVHVAFCQSNLDLTVKAADELGTLASEILSSNSFATSNLFRVLHHDYTTFTHSANVAFYCGMLAVALGFRGEDVRRITIGGLLHDLGKLEVNGQILCKVGRLDQSDYRQIRLHPILGFRKLAHRQELNEGQLMMAYQHHERIDGRGYPVGCVGTETHPWARLCAVVDVFEAVTSLRPYRQPLSRSKALALQERESGSAFDAEMLKCWKSVIQSSFAT